MTKKNPLWFERLVVAITVAFMKVLARMPLAWVQRLGAMLGWLMTRLHTRPAQITRINLRLCFPEKTERELNQRALESMQETAKTMLEFSHVWFRSADDVLATVVETQGTELVDQALAQGKGVLFLGPHLGNWEVTGLYLASRYHMASMYRPPKMETFERVITQARSRTSAELVPTSQRGVARLLAILKKGGVAGILPDQVPAPESAEFSKFFGEYCHTMTLASRLAQKTKPSVFVAFALRLPKGSGYRLIIEPAEAAVTDPDLVTSLDAVNRSVEKAVMRAPSQYQWEYKRFRRRLPGQKKLY